MSSVAEAIDLPGPNNFARKEQEPNFADKAMKHLTDVAKLLKSEILEKDKETNMKRAA